MTTRPRFFSGGAAREFHVSRRAREKYGLEATLFSATGNVVFADFHAARLFAHRINERRNVDRHPERAISASEIHALGLIDEVLHLVVARHRRQRAPRLWAEALAALEADHGREAVDQLLLAFVDEFPPSAVYRNEVAPEAYLAGETAGESHRELALEELVMLWLANRNPAFTPYRELFDDEGLRRATAYGSAARRLETFLAGSKTAGPAGESLLDLLLAPVRAAPDSLQGQLEFIRTAWAELLGPDLHRVLGGLDFLAEEQRAFFPAGPGPIEPPDYRVLAESGERYSADREWMPRLVLLAKNAHVWLAQLSGIHGRAITKLDGIPDDELDRLAGWGITGLWLIGVWERSRASQRIKRMMGDEEAVASAYSLRDYVVAEALGGEAAYENLRARAWARGIRISTDMVPNHMGIDSRWMIEHPDWFLSVDRTPFPAYSFDGPDLSDDERVGIFIEDHYWRRSDAAVVFKRLDRYTGDVRYVYHGNDGTSMPWNDTAQLDYLKAEVREAVIQTILAVARRSPVIRFDAAMTLARQHYHRLWFPEPGAAGAIPSRAEFALTRAEFDAAMPREFWREVVDRVAEEAPDTLLLAEAFWLLEGYFVRTLGMHRVYNSAFMHMLRDERNAEYRQLIRSTLEFDPQILKRYVNFMSNPDERTAVDQFGTGDKYFGVATLMVTMPGLPMLGHGQIEGLAEKYGMEFERPRWNESPNEGLVWRHEVQLFPLLRRRRLFSEVDRFLLYDFVTDEGLVDENVFAYSNEIEGERSLVVYHNRFAETCGTIRLSTAVADPASGDERRLVRTSLGDGLRLPDDERAWVVYRDVVTGLERLRSCRELRSDGLRFELDAYRLHCLHDFREIVEDDDHPCRALAEQLAGNGVRSVDDALGQLTVTAVLEPFRRLLSVAGDCGTDGDELLAPAAGEVEAVLAAASERLGRGVKTTTTEASILGMLGAVVELAAEARGIQLDKRKQVSTASWMAWLSDVLEQPSGWATALSWLIGRGLDELDGDDGQAAPTRSRFEEWHLRSTLIDHLIASGQSEGVAGRAADTASLMIASDRPDDKDSSPDSALAATVVALFDIPTGKRCLMVNRHAGVLWFNREAFTELLGWLALPLVVAAMLGSDDDTPARIAEIAAAADRLVLRAEAAGWRVGEFAAAPGSAGRSPVADES